MDVRWRLMQAPWWVVSLVTGTLFGLGMFAFSLLDERSVAASAIGAAVMGVFFGLVMGPIASRNNRRHGAAMGEMSRGQQREVRRAVLRGPAPADPDVRRATLAVIGLQIDTYRKLRWAPFMYLLFIALSLWLAVSDGGWWILAVLFFTGLLVVHLWTPRHLRSRQLLLAGDRV